ncbi:MAG: molybdopterin-guanine dinucleotide biosynthesis protein B [Gemmatimonadaceae bacterium]
MTPPILSIVGRKNSGKTTLVVALVAELHRRGHRVMTIKHGAHTFNIDPQTTDTYRHFHEGNAERVAMAAPDKFALVMRWSEELAPEEIAARFLGEADIVIAEGFKASALPRIEVHRREVHETPLYAPSAPNAGHYLALVTDDAQLRAPIPVLALASASVTADLADLVEQRLLPGRGRT